MTIEIKYREPGYPLITYHLAVDEKQGSPIVVEEWLAWKRGSHGQPFRFLDYREGTGRAVSGEKPDIEDERQETPLKSADLIAVNALGQFEAHPRVAALREFITGWYVSYFSVDNTRGQAQYRDPDSIAGGTWEALERILQRSHYFPGGIRKLEIAQEIGSRFDCGNCTSRSFSVFREAVIEAVGA
jgi:hypothetical protein